MIGDNAATPERSGAGASLSGASSAGGHEAGAPRQTGADAPRETGPDAPRETGDGGDGDDAASTAASANVGPSGTSASGAPIGATPDRSYDGALEWLVDDPMLHEPTLVVMLTGWIDAASAAEAAAVAVADAAEATPLARFDDDTFIDFRARRPTMELRDGVNTNLLWATTELKMGRIDGNDIVLLVGPEPDMAWHRFCRIVADVATTLGVRRMVGFGAYPFAAPHTRPSRLSVSSPSTDMLARVPYARSSVDVPAGAAAAIEHAMHSAKIPAIGLWAQVPHYVSGAEYPAASVALLDGFREVTAIDIAAPSLRAGVAKQRRRIDSMVENNPEHRALVEQLEELYDAALADEAEASDAPPDVDGELELRSGDEIADEIQRFLRGSD